MKASIIVAFILLIAGVNYAQTSSKIYFEPEMYSKISFGEEKRKTIDYRPGFSINTPSQSHYNNPLFGLGISVGYLLTPSFSVSMNSGIDLVRFENFPVASTSYYDKIIYPLSLGIRHQKEFTTWILISELNGGYNFVNFDYLNTSEGFIFHESGGPFLNFGLGIGKRIGKYVPILKIGYEIDRFDHEDSLGWIPGNDLTYDDKVFYSTFYQMIKVGIGLGM